MGICLLVWCLGQASPSFARAIVAHDVLTGNVNVFAYERPWMTAGFVHQTDTRNAVFGGVLPLNVRLFNGQVALEGGAVIASSPVPFNGSPANLMAGARVPLSNRVALMYWHWSNAGLGHLHLSVNAVGLSVRVGAG